MGRGAIDAGVSLDEAAAEADLLFLSQPICVILETLADLLRKLDSNRATDDDLRVNLNARAQQFACAAGPVAFRIAHQPRGPVRGRQPRVLRDGPRRATARLHIARCGVGDGGQRIHRDAVGPGDKVHANRQGPVPAQHGPGLFLARGGRGANVHQRQRRRRDVAA